MNIRLLLTREQRHTLEDLFQEIDSLEDADPLAQLLIQSFTFDAIGVSTEEDKSS